MKHLWIKDNRGFTLVELLVVLATILVLIGLLLPKLMGSSDKKIAVSIMRNAEKISSALGIYRSDIGKYPTKLSELWDKNQVATTDRTYWKGPYMDIPEMYDTNTGNIQEKTVSGVTYSLAVVTTTGGSGSCSNAGRIGTANNGGTDYTIKISNVPVEIAKVIKDQMGNKVCIASPTSATTDVYVPFDERW